tara:strand:+ start:742 stop:957 length:216 start_codon:yes stop_codon:yes gene_type:complete
LLKDFNVDTEVNVDFEAEMGKTRNTVSKMNTQTLFRDSMEKRTHSPELKVIKDGKGGLKVEINKNPMKKPS